MPLILEKGDITKFKVDAIVNAANNSLLGGGGVDGCIHRTAGPELLEECKTLGGCATGMAKITKGYKLPAKFVIHTVGPVWRGGNYGEKDTLASCYRNSLQLAVENGCESVAFPLISSGAYGYPKQSAFDVASEAIRSFLSETESDLLVYIVFYNEPKPYMAKRNVLKDYLEFGLLEIIEAYIKDKLSPKDDNFHKAFSKSSFSQKLETKDDKKIDSQKAEEILHSSILCCEYAGSKSALPDFIIKKGESFSEKLLKYIKKADMTNSECYSRANVSKQVFSNIISDEDYSPKKPVALAFAVALNLSVAETESLLKSAGLALSDCNRFDLIVQYFLERHEYDIFRINEILMEYGEPQLGSGVRKKS